MTDAPAVAIVGMSGRFPGARDLAEYWRNLRDGVCSIADFGEEELLASGVDPEELRSPGYVPAKGFLAGADRFEHELFGFNATEAAALDPQHRLVLETAWAALEDAGYDPRGVPEGTGVYVGGGPTEHSVAAQVDRRLRARLGPMHVRIFTDREFLAGWLSYRLGLTGPSMTVHTACSTSLATVHVAVQALLTGECDLALAGGVSIDSPYPRGYLYEPGGIYSPDGRCRPFDEKAAGMVGGDGVGLVVLRRLEDAQADGDQIYAVIRGTAVSNDGAARVGFTAPGVDGQTAAILEAWAAAGLDPADAQFLEAHGTGTDLGDRIEVAAAAAAFAGARCELGSVKSNIGHLNAAAGVAGLIKVALMLAHRTMVPTVNVTRPHPDLDLDATPFHLLTETREWDARVARLAGVSSLGIGGTNVHAVLEEAPPSDRRSPTPSYQRPETSPHRDTSAAPSQSTLADPSQSTLEVPSQSALEGIDPSAGAAPEPGTSAVVLPLSARTQAQLSTAAQRLAAALREPGAPPLADVAHTLAHGRAAFDARAYVVAATHEEAAAALEALTSAPTGTSAPVKDPLGEAWVAGREVGWPSAGRRVHLPTYPFAGDSHGALTLSPQPTAPEPQPEDRAEDRATAVSELFMTTLALSAPSDLDRTYFAVGGDSLTAVFLVSELRDRFGLDLPIETFLREHTLNEIIARALNPEDDDPLGDLLDELEQ
ncbi:beta-ketoacyl synthase N-terminal-like domain-containing protein [Nonomuraea sp. NPDC049695]|uniref:beta-ketoacyl synthase N-terminal-like domain-containing protein n=1 Tax=Nonomuraea sp. NPDC049695 TaxID=3154734 RepID=UPI00342966C5